MKIRDCAQLPSQKRTYITDRLGSFWDF